MTTSATTIEGDSEYFSLTTLARLEPILRSRSADHSDTSSVIATESLVRFLIGALTPEQAETTQTTLTRTPEERIRLRQIGEIVIGLQRHAETLSDRQPNISGPSPLVTEVMMAWRTVIAERVWWAIQSREKTRRLPGPAIDAITPDAISAWNGFRDFVYGALRSASQSAPSFATTRSASPVQPGQELVTITEVVEKDLVVTARTMPGSAPLPENTRLELVIEFAGTSWSLGEGEVSDGQIRWKMDGFPRAFAIDQPPGLHIRMLESADTDDLQPVPVTLMGDRVPEAVTATLILDDSGRIVLLLDSADGWDDWATLQLVVALVVYQEETQVVAKSMVSTLTTSEQPNRLHVPLLVPSLPDAPRPLALLPFLRISLE